jgi:bifunctional enzyme CysN/CysC
MNQSSNRLLRIVAFGGREKSSPIERLLQDGASGVAVSRASFESAALAAEASRADAALICVDPGADLDTSAVRYARLCGLFGIRHLAIALDATSAAAWTPDAFQSALRDCESFCCVLGFDSVLVVPVCIARGSNVLAPDPSMSWYRGPTLREHFEGLKIEDPNAWAFRMPIDEVIDSRAGRPRYRGRIAAGLARKGALVRLLPSGLLTRVTRIETVAGDSDAAGTGAIATLTLADEVDAARGHLLTDAASPLEVAHQFEARLLWLSEEDLLPGRIYKAQIHSCEVDASVTKIKYLSDPASGAHLAAKTQSAGDLATVNLNFDREVPFEPFAENRALGAVTFLEHAGGQVLGAAIIEFALRRATNVHWQATEVTPQRREAIKGQHARCFWFTGLPSSGKSTVANLLEKRLHTEGLHTFLLDGDNVRHGLNRDLGFTEADRVENVRRITEVARLMVDAGLVVLVSIISPFRAERAAARKFFKPGDFVEVFVDTPLAVCERRDPKGLYAKARTGSLKNFTGIDSPYEPPDQPEARIETIHVSAERAAEQLARLALRK